MRFRFTNLGPIDSADLTLGDLTIIFGRNNTGKTYLTYSLYGFLHAWRGWPGAHEFLLSDAYRRPPTHPSSSRLPQIDRLTKTVRASGQAVHPVAPESLAEARALLLPALTRSFSEAMLPAVFNSSTSDFADARLAVEFTDPFPTSIATLNLKRGKGERLSMAYEAGAITVEWTGGDRTATSLAHMISQLYVRLLCTGFPEAFVITAERFGVSLFYKDLDFARSQLVDQLQKLGTEGRKRVSPFLIIDHSTSRYALPIKDHIDFTRSIPDMRKHLGQLGQERTHSEIRALMGGYYKASADGISFKSRTRGEHSFEIPLHLASSSARGLSDLFFFLKHIAHDNHLLIIDEPESHLDTRNQIHLARLLSRLIGLGIKVLVTTHSDYLLKEINNLIMLHHLGDRGRATATKLGYSPKDALPQGAVRAYVAQDRGLAEAPIDRFGVDVPVFDETIDSINMASNELVAALEADRSGGSPI